MPRVSLHGADAVSSDVTLVCEKYQRQAACLSIEGKRQTTCKCVYHICYSCSCELDPMILIHELDLDILKMKLHAENEVPR